MDFFTRIDDLDLVPGSKTAGFLYAVQTDALQALHKLEVTEDEWAILNEVARARVDHSSLVATNIECGFSRVDGSAAPKAFWVHRGFAGSLSAPAEELQALGDPDMQDFLGPEVIFSPHNVDSPAEALVLVVLVQTWSEWARDKLLANRSSRRLSGPQAEDA